MSLGDARGHQTALRLQRPKTLLHSPKKKPREGPDDAGDAVLVAGEPRFNENAT